MAIVRRAKRLASGVAPDLVNGGQVTVGVCERWVDLDGAGVALQRSLHVLHLLQGVAHVGVGVGKRGTYPRERETPERAHLSKRTLKAYTATHDHVHVWLRRRPDRLLVVHEGFLELPLLLEDAGQVGVSCGKLRENLGRRATGGRVNTPRLHRFKSQKGRCGVMAVLTSRAFL